MRKYLALAVLAVAGAGLAVAMQPDEGAATRPTTTDTNGHTPVTICHKPGTPAEMELTTDDSSIIDAHLMHGDTLGPCPTGTTTETTTTTETETEPPTTTTETEPPTTTTETQPPSDCPPGMIHGRGHDGNEGNDDCCFPGVNCDGDPTGTTPTTPGTTPEPPVTVPPTTNPEPPVTAPEPPAEGTPPAAKPPASPKPPKAHKPPHKAPKPPKMPPVCSAAGVETGPCAVAGQG